MTMPGSGPFAEIHYEQALRASEARFRTLVELNADGVLVVTPEGVVRFANPAAEALLGRPARELVGTLFGLPVAPGGATEIDVLHGPHQPAGIAELRAVPIEWEGQPAYLASLRDVTERHRQYEASQTAVRQRDEFLAMLAHELRNPLAPILNAALLLQRSAPADAPLRRACEVVNRQARQMARLLDDLLDLSRMTRGTIELRKEPVRMAAVVADAVEASQALLEARGQRLEVALPAGPVTLDADPVRLTQILTNLLNNAAKHTPPAGRVWLTVAGSADGVVLTVRDDGLGIPAEVLPRVFEPFAQFHPEVRRAQGGLGIGLTLVRRLTELHGGRVTARSAGPNQGSEFEVWLPLGAGTRNEGERTEGVPPPSAARRSCRVALVEDNPCGREMLGELLRMDGHEVLEAEDGVAGLELIRTCQPDVALIDIDLPRLDGYQVAERVRADGVAPLPLLVALTGYGQPEDRRRTAAAGFDVHLVKPVDLDVLTDLLAGRAAAPAGKGFTPVSPGVISNNS